VDDPTCQVWFTTEGPPVTHEPDDLHTDEHTLSPETPADGNSSNWPDELVTAPQGPGPPQVAGGAAFCRVFLFGISRADDTTGCIHPGVT